jgi:XRE family transcriptional regulator, fatty acid utilization regulator
MGCEQSEAISAIRRCRTARGLTQAQVAAAIGYTASYFAMIEREPRLLTRPLAHRLSALFAVPPEELYQ